MNCLIVEDEKVAAERLQSLIETVEPGIEIIGILQTVKSSVEWFSQNSQPDLIFMDIQLADGLSFEIFEQTHIKAPVIFATAYNEYALKAFKLNSIDYLLKPIDESELRGAIQKFKSTARQREYPAELFDTLLKNLTNRYKSKFVIKVGERIKLITTDEVQCFYSMEKAVYLQTGQGRAYDLNYTLDQLEELLDPAKFFRISRKHIVALSAIKDIVSFSNSRLQVVLESKTSDELIVSRERVQIFKKWLEE